MDQDIPWSARVDELVEGARDQSTLVADALRACRLIYGGSLHVTVLCPDDDTLTALSSRPDIVQGVVDLSAKRHFDVTIDRMLSTEATAGDSALDGAQCLLTICAEVLTEYGTWPTLDYMKAELRRRGHNPKAALDSLPDDLGGVTQHPDGQLVQLRLRGLRRTELGKGALASVCTVLNQLAEFQAGHYPGPTTHRTLTVTRDELKTALAQEGWGPDERELSLAHMLLSQVPRVLRGSTGSADAGFSLQLDPDVVEYAGVKGIGELVEKAQPASSVRLARSDASPATAAPEDARTVGYDVFICHASEDKIGIATPLAEALRKAGMSVWYDSFSIAWGDSIVAKINEGLANSKCGIVILSPVMLDKQWATREMQALCGLMVEGRVRLLPIWHGLDNEVLAARAPLLVDIRAERSDIGVTELVSAVAAILGSKIS